MSSAMRLLDDAMSRIHNCPVMNAQKGVEGGAKDDDELAGLSSQLARVCGGAEARRAEPLTAST